MSATEDNRYVSFEERDRMTLEEAKKEVANATAWVRHVLDNGDGTFSIMSHINCEWCDYCSAQELFDIKIHKAKPDPYELEHKAIAKAEAKQKKERLEDAEEDQHWDHWQRTINEGVVG